MHRNITLSPPQESHFQMNDLKLSAYYSSPSVRGRVIFGDVADGVLLPNGKYWGLGANESTEIELSEPMTVMGQRLNSGRHKVYCYPDEKMFTFCFAPADGAWGAMEPDRNKEYLTVEISEKKWDKPLSSSPFLLLKKTVRI